MPEKQLDPIGLKLLTTARTLFEKCGVEKVSMHQVAQTAGVGQGTLYRRYPSKAALCQTLMESEFTKFIRRVDAYLQEASSEPVKTRLTRVLAMLLQLAGSDIDFLKAMMASSREREAVCGLHELRPFVYMRDTVRSLLQEASRQGQLLELDTDFASTVIASTFTPELIVQLRDMGYSSEQIAERYGDSFIRTLFKTETV